MKIKSGFLAVCLGALIVVPSVYAQIAPIVEHEWKRISFIADELIIQGYAEPLANARAGNSIHPDAMAALDNFKRKHGDRWVTSVDLTTGGASLIYGQGVAWLPGPGNSLTTRDVASRMNGRPELDTNMVASIARDFLPDVAPILRGAIAELVVNQQRSRQTASHLWSIEFDVRPRGSDLPVEDASVFFRVNNGNMVMFGARNVPPPGTRIPDFVVSRDEALVNLSQYIGGLVDGRDWFADGGSRRLLPGTTRSGEGQHNRRPYQLYSAWEFTFIRDDVSNGTWRARIDAETGELIEFRDINEYASAQITGDVYPVSFIFENPVNVPMPFAALSGGASGEANSAGVYDYTSSTTATLSNQYLDVNDNCGGGASAFETSDGSGAIDFGTTGGCGPSFEGCDCDTPTGASSSSNTFASRMQFYNLNRAKERFRGFHPSNSWATGGSTPADVNINQTCNAYFSPSTNGVGFYRAGPIPTNTAYHCGNTGEMSGVSLHEFGHGADNNDGNGSSPENGTGEAYGDAMAWTQSHNSCTGNGFWLQHPVSTLCSGYGDACTVCSGIRDVDWQLHATGLPHTADDFDVAGDFDCPNDASYRGPCGKEGHCESYITSEAMYDFAVRDLRAGGGTNDYDGPYATAAAAWGVMDRLWFLSRPTARSAYQCSTSPDYSTDGCGANNYYPEFLAVDDDNGDLTDGTPHACVLYASFDRHNIACPPGTPDANKCFSGCTNAPGSDPVITASPFTNRIEISYSSVGANIVYDIYRNESSCDAGFTRIANDFTGTLFSDTNVSNGGTYYYQVIAHPDDGNESCASAPSNCASASPIAQPSAIVVDGSEVLGAITGGDADQYLDNCEASSYSFTIKNDGNADLTSVTVDVTSEDANAVTVTTSMPIAVGGLVQDATSAINFDFEVGTGGTSVACAASYNFTVTVDSPEQSTASTYLFSTPTMEHDDTLLSPTHGFDTDADGWTLNGFSRDNSTSSPGGGFSLHSSSGANGACDAATSPEFVATAASAVTLAVRYDIEAKAQGKWWDRANIHVVNVDTGVHTLITPSSGAGLYDSLAGGNQGLCHNNAEDGWASNNGPSWEDATFDLSAFDGQRLQLEANYNTDTSAALTGLWIDNVRFTSILFSGCDGTTDSCAACTPPDKPTSLSVTDSDSCALGVTITYSTTAATHDLWVDGALAISNFNSGDSYTPADTSSHSYVIRAKDATCFTDSDPTAFSDGDATPDAPTITSIVDVDLCNQTGIQVNYTVGAGATNYDLYRGGALLVTDYVSGATVATPDTASYTYTIRARNATCSIDSAGSAFADAGGACAPIVSFLSVGSYVESCGDGDALIEPGEEWQLTVTLQNTGAATATGTTASLAKNASSSLNATVIDGNVGSFGDIAAAGTGTADFIFRVDSATVCDNVDDLITFDVNSITSNTSIDHGSTAPAFTTAVGQTNSEASSQLTDPISTQSGSAETDFLPAFALAGATSFNIDYVLTYGSGNEVATAPDFSASTTTTQALTFTTIAPAGSAIFSYTPTSRAGKINSATLIGPGPAFNTQALSTPGNGNVDGVPVSDDVTIFYNTAGNGAGVYQLQIVMSGTFVATITSVTLTVSGVASGTIQDDIKIELIDPSATVSELKGYGVADAPPWNRQDLYTGPGTYKLRVSEQAGGIAELKGGTMDLVYTECNLAACTDEVSPASSSYPVNLVRDSASSTGFYLFFENKVWADGYHVYKDDDGTFGTGDECWMQAQTTATLVSGGTWDGYRRLEIAEPTVNSYYLVTAYNNSSEDTAGYDSAGTERSAVAYCTP